MSRPLLLRTGGDRTELAATVQRALDTGQTVAIAAPEEADLLAAALPAKSPSAWGAARPSP